MKIVLDIRDVDTEEIKKAVDNIQSESEIEKVNAICFWLIRMASMANSEVTTITQENVTHLDKKLGTYQITIKKLLA